MTRKTQAGGRGVGILCTAESAGRAETRLKYLSSYFTVKRFSSHFLKKPWLTATRSRFTKAGAAHRCHDQRIGVDLMLIAEVAASLDHFGDRYTHRLFTAAERSACETGDTFGHPPAPAVVAARYAARFAAKESVIKVLQPIGSRPDWRTIQTRRAPSGSLTVALVEEAAELAGIQGIFDVQISVTHEGAYAAAIAVAQCHPGGSRETGVGDGRPYP